MSTERAHLEQSLAAEFATSFASVLEGMAGTRPEFSCEPLSADLLTDSPESVEQRWRQPMPPLPGAVWVAISRAGARAVGQQVMQAAEVEDSSPEELAATYQEAVGQALSSLGQVLGKRIGQEVTASGGAEASELPSGVEWVAVRLALGETPITIILGLETALVDRLLTQTKAAAASASSPSSPAPEVVLVQQPPHNATADSKTFDLLLDVELPVSVSFGHAQVALKDVLKLTTGSIIELSRAIIEPVDVVVNNCVIARGEVVVVEGNFGVRIQQVASRNERLRSLK